MLLKYTKQHQNKIVHGSNQRYKNIHQFLLQVSNAEIKMFSVANSEANIFFSVSEFIYVFDNKSLF